MLLEQKLLYSSSSSIKQIKFWPSFSKGKILKLSKSIFAGISPNLSLLDENPDISTCVSQ